MIASVMIFAGLTVSARVRAERAGGTAHGRAPCSPVGLTGSQSPSLPPLPIRRAGSGRSCQRFGHPEQGIDDVRQPGLGDKQPGFVSNDLGEHAE